MINLSDFYDKLDLKYPEIAIAMQDIDRRLPCQYIKFTIPILTPNANNTSIIKKKIHQNKMNLMNASTHKLEIEDITLTNCIMIPVPGEVLGVNYNQPIIDRGSKWIVVFVGGDITKPRIIARYPD